MANSSPSPQLADSAPRSMSLWTQWWILTAVVVLSIVLLAGEELITLQNMMQRAAESMREFGGSNEPHEVDWVRVLITWMPWLVLAPGIAYLGVRFVPGRSSWWVALLVHLCAACIAATLVKWAEHSMLHWHYFHEWSDGVSGMVDLTTESVELATESVELTTEMTPLDDEGVAAESFVHETVMIDDGWWWFWGQRFWRFVTLSAVAVIPGLALLSTEREQLRAGVARELTDVENRLLRAQLQPHFLFNTLNGIQVLVDEDPERSKVCLRQLSALLRNTLEDANLPLLTLSRELEILDDYLELERVRFGDRMSFELDVSREELGAVMVPSFFLQPLVENSLVHGPGSRSAGGRVRVSARRDGTNLVCDVEDDGPGLALAEGRSAPREGHGLGILRRRLDRQFGERATLTIETPESGLGLRVRVVLPLEMTA